MTTDLTKPVKTRDGHSVEILTTKRRHPTHPVVGLVDTVDCDAIVAWTAEGRLLSNDTESPYDLINVPEKRRGYINVYPDCRDCELFMTRSRADQYAASDRIKCVEVEYEV